MTFSEIKFEEGMDK